MSRIGFDKRIHPYQLQLRICNLLDPEGIQNRGSVTLDFCEGKITNTFSMEEKINPYTPSRQMSRKAKNREETAQ